MLFCPIPCITLLSRHNQAHLGFRVLDQITAHIHGDAVDLAGELEQRRVLGRDGQTGIGATDLATGIPPKNQCSRRREQILYPTGYSFGYGFCAPLRLQFFYGIILVTLLGQGLTLRVLLPRWKEKLVRAEVEEPV